MKKILPIATLLVALVCAGCSNMRTYQDYPWGDYPWENARDRHVDSVQAWDDYRQAFGRNQPKPPGG